MIRDYIKEFNHHNERAWSYFYADYYSAMCSYVNRIVKDKSDAEDIVQATFIKIWESDRTFDSMKDLTWYLYRAVYLNAINHIQRKDLHIKLSVNFDVDTVTLQDENFSLAVRQELVRELRLAVDQLPNEAKKILNLSLDGLSGQEISDFLNISINTVKSQKKRSLVYLRSKLKDIDFMLIVLSI